MNINKVAKKYMPIIIIGFSFLLAAIFTSLKKDEKKKIVEKHIPTIETFHAKKRDFQIYLEKVMVTSLWLVFHQVTIR